MGCRLTKAVSSKKKNKGNGLLQRHSCTVSCEVTDPPERPTLTRNQRAILTNTSKLLVENISRVGVITFMNLFETHPDVQEVFMPFKGLSGNDLRYSRELRAHAFRVMGVVQKVITRLNEEEKLDQLLTDLGKKHARYGAKPQYIDLIGPQFVHAIKPSLEDHWTTEMEEAWCQLFRYIAWVMKAAMVEHQSECEVSSVQSFHSKID
ncbi:cytoglobin-2-like [Limulus polyphemus]|uniref:Cytoglobin-2-like n=1 Tax=Limulus polyphemus TaxID=6850 RepID=A0ABM1T4E6_LIMPO|nr:cytoglobin-2-like [Limulus polyphemus]XP_022250750.1 cytoglobin-2-like [Limulus polyphemus]XP_022250751.1 cytoglobin-2-like [Limulus polyphemus]XP_022250752.1 cytoglobin-2-like [Limulus polyphemus]